MTGCSAIPHVTYVTSRRLINHILTDTFNSFINYQLFIPCAAPRGLIHANLLSIRSFTTCSTLIICFRYFLSSFVVSLCLVPRINNKTAFLGRTGSIIVTNDFASSPHRPSALFHQYPSSSRVSHPHFPSRRTLPTTRSRLHHQSMALQICYVHHSTETADSSLNEKDPPLSILAPYWLCCECVGQYFPM